MNEIAVRKSWPDKLTPHSFGALLGPHLLVTSAMADGWNMTLRIEGLLAPWPEPGIPVPEAPALRRAYLDSLDAVIAILNAAGARWQRHPQVFIAGEVQHRADGGQEFDRMEGRVTLDLLMPETFR